MRNYTVYMVHKMRSVQEVVANSVEEAKEKAYEGYCNDVIQISEVYIE